MVIIYETKLCVHESQTAAHKMQVLTGVKGITKQIAQNTSIYDFKKYYLA